MVHSTEEAMAIVFTIFLPVLVILAGTITAYLRLLTAKLDKAREAAETAKTLAVVNTNLISKAIEANTEQNTKIIETVNKVDKQTNGGIDKLTAEIERLKAENAALKKRCT
jgi:uncharacterized small protein (DUF1192 family)